MRKTLIFFILSLLFHLPLLFLTFQPTANRTEEFIPIDIISKEHPLSVAQPEPQPAPAPISPDRPIPHTPAPEETVPVRPLPEPNINDNDDGKQQEDEQSSARPPIIPKNISPDNPPPPMTLNELLNEQKNRELYGPDRNKRDIVRDYLNEQQQQLPPDEDSVSFNNMSAKYDSYFYKFARALYGIWRYPPDAAKRGESGIVRVTFAINKDGSITDINMIESSGYPALDREVMRTLRSMPKVELPDSYELKVLHINGYFIYTLTGEYRLY